MLAFTPGLRSPSEAEEMWTALTPTSMDLFAALRGEVPDAGAAVNSQGRIAPVIGRKLVRGINQPSSGLEPGLYAARPGEKVPAEDDRRDTHAAKGSASHRQGTGVRLTLRRIADGLVVVRRRRVCLPKRHNVAAELELPAENARMNHGRNRFGELKSAPEELVVRPVSHAGAPVEEGPIFPALILAYLRHRISWIIRASLRRLRHCNSGRSRHHKQYKPLRSSQIVSKPPIENSA